EARDLVDEAVVVEAGGLPAGAGGVERRARGVALCGGAVGAGDGSRGRAAREERREENAGEQGGGEGEAVHGRRRWSGCRFNAPPPGLCACSAEVGEVGPQLLQLGPRVGGLLALLRHDLLGRAADELRVGQLGLDAAEEPLLLRDLLAQP